MLSDISLAIEKRDPKLLTERISELAEEADAAYRRAESLEVEYEKFMADVNNKIAELKACIKEARRRKDHSFKPVASLFISTVLPSLLLLPLTSTARLGATQNVLQGQPISIALQRIQMVSTLFLLPTFPV